MNHEDSARQRVAEEMDWWRHRMFDKVKTEYGRDYLCESEILLCAILAAASLREMSDEEEESEG